MQGLRLFDVTCHVELAAGAAREVHDLVAAAAPLASTPEQGMGVYTEAAKKLNRLFASLTDLVVAVGQAHLLRQRIAMQLRNMNGCAATMVADTCPDAMIVSDYKLHGRVPLSGGERRSRGYTRGWGHIAVKAVSTNPTPDTHARVSV